jgi:hypothetical protein
MSFFDPVPLMALEQIEDTNIRTVLQSIANGLQVRNGETGTGEHAFVTRADLTRVTGAPVRFGYSGQWPTLSEAMGQSTSQAVTDVESAIVNSLAFQQLGDQVAQVNTDVIAEQTARIAAVQAEATARIAIGNDLSALVTRVGTAESNITTLQSTTSTQTTSISSLTTRVGTAESNITNLQSTTSTTSTNLSSLTTRVGTAESNISTLQTTTSNQATTLSTLTTTVGQKARTFLQADAPTASGTGDLWFDSDDSNKPYRWSGSAWVATDDTRIAAVQASITSEATTRANDDNAITSSMSTQFSTVNGNISSLQSTQTTLSNNVSTLSSSVSTLTATVGGHTTSIQNETEARVSADGQINAKNTIKIDTNGYVSGYGLISEANNATPTSSFIVRADKFAIGSPSGPGITPTLPFSVLTTADADGNQPGVYIEKAFIKKIKADEIDTRGLTVKDADDNVLFGSGTPLSVSNISGLGSLATQNSVSAGSVSGLGAFATVDQITPTNVSTYIAGASIKYAQIGDAEVDTLKIAGQAVTIPRGSAWSGNASFLHDILLTETSTEDFTGAKVVITASMSMNVSGSSNTDTARVVVYKNGSAWMSFDVGTATYGALVSGSITFVDSNPGVARYGVGCGANGSAPNARARSGGISVMAGKR